MKRISDIINSYHYENDENSYHYENDEILEKKESITGNEARTWPLFSYWCCFYVLYFLIIAVTIGWSFLFGFSIPWPAEGEYPLWKISLFGVTYEPLTNSDWGSIFLYEFIDNYTSFKHWLLYIPLFDFLPYLILSPILCFTRQRKWKWYTGILFGLITLCLQVLFGYLSYVAWYSVYSGYDVGTVSQHILLFGGFGILLAITYGIVLYYSYEYLLRSSQPKDKLKALFFAHLLAFLASIFILASAMLSWLSIIAMVFFILPIISLIILTIDGVRNVIMKKKHLNKGI